MCIHRKYVLKLKDQCVAFRGIRWLKWNIIFLICFFIAACEKDSQCGGRMCCAVSLWFRSLRMCTPAGREGDDCHPMSHKIPFNGKRLHHTCPCLPKLLCITLVKGRSKCNDSHQSYYL
uniref:Prokineticin 2 n=1 Tax=Cyclopterus lumpus TaxID=8103 RepID=A0A8C3AM43_CYCLU